MELHPHDIGISTMLPCQVIDMDNQGSGNTLAYKTGTTHYYTQLGLPGRGSAIIELVVRVRT